MALRSYRYGAVEEIKLQAEHRARMAPVGVARSTYSVSMTINRSLQ
jgi:hypothetical protein